MLLCSEKFSHPHFVSLNSLKCLTVGCCQWLLSWNPQWLRPRLYRFWQRSSKKTTSDEVVDLVTLGTCQSRWTALITAPPIWERPSKRCQWGSSYSIKAPEPLLWNRIQSVILNFIHHVACFSSSSLSFSCATKALQLLVYLSKKGPGWIVLVLKNQLHHLNTINHAPFFRIVHNICI